MTDSDKSSIELNRDQLKQAAKLIEEQKLYNVVLQASGGDCGCVHLVSRVGNISWRIDQQGRVQGR